MQDHTNCRRSINHRQICRIDASSKGPASKGPLVHGVHHVLNLALPARVCWPHPGPHGSRSIVSPAWRFWSCPEGGNGRSALQARNRHRRLNGRTLQRLTRIDSKMSAAQYTPARAIHSHACCRYCMFARAPAVSLLTIASLSSYSMTLWLLGWPSWIILTDTVARKSTLFVPLMGRVALQEIVSQGLGFPAHIHQRLV